MGELEPFLVKINSALASKDRVFLDKGQNKKFWFPYMFKHEKYTKTFYLWTDISIYHPKDKLTRTILDRITGITGIIYVTAYSMNWRWVNEQYGTLSLH